MEVNDVKLEGTFNKRVIFKDENGETHNLSAYGRFIGRIVSLLTGGKAEKVIVYVDKGNEKVRKEIYVNIGSILGREIKAKKLGASVEQAMDRKTDWSKAPHFEDDYEEILILKKKDSQVEDSTPTLASMIDKVIQLDAMRIHRSLYLNNPSNPHIEHQGKKYLPQADGSWKEAQGEKVITPTEYLEMNVQKKRE